MERLRPLPEGAPVRPQQRGGQPRRGREGGLPLRRRAAVARLQPHGLPLPAARLPLRGAACPQRHARSARPGIRACRHRDLRRRRLFRRHDGICQGRCRRHPDHDQRPQRLDRTGDAAPSAADLGAQHLVVEQRAGRGTRLDRPGAGRQPDAEAPRPEAATAHPRRGGDMAVHGKRHQCAAAVRQRATGSVQGRDQRLRRPRPGRLGLSQPARQQGGGAARARSAGLGRSENPPAAAVGGRCFRPVRRRFRRDRHPAAAGGGRLLRGRPRRARRPRCPRRPEAGAGGAALVEAGLHLRCPGLARRRSRQSGAAGLSPPGPQQRLAAPQQCRRDPDARQVGIPLVRGLGPRFPLRRHGGDRSRFRQAAAHPAQPCLVHAPERPVAGLRMGLRRRQPAGAGLGRLPRL